MDVHKSEMSDACYTSRGALLARTHGRHLYNNIIRYYILLLLGHWSRAEVFLISILCASRLRSFFFSFYKIIIVVAIRAIRIHNNSTRRVYCKYSLGIDFIPNTWLRWALSQVNDCNRLSWVQTHTRKCIYNNNCSTVKRE